jgi:hypothetical protein
MLNGPHCKQFISRLQNFCSREIKICERGGDKQCCPINYSVEEPHDADAAPAPRRQNDAAFGSDSFPMTNIEQILKKLHFDAAPAMLGYKRNTTASWGSGSATLLKIRLFLAVLRIGDDLIPDPGFRILYYKQRVCKLFKTALRAFLMS